MAKKISGWVKKSENKFLYIITWLIHVISILIIKYFCHPGISDQGKLQLPETFTISHTQLEGHY